MKKLLTILAVLMCLSISMTAYAQSAPEADRAAQNNPNATASIGENVDDPLPIEPKTDQDNTPRLADGIPGKGAIENPVEYWEANGYPDNISFAFEGGSENIDGTNIVFWIIGIVNADDKSKQEIIDLLSVNSRITFENCTYSYNQREAAYNAILAMKDDKILDVIFLRGSEKIQIIVATDNVVIYSESLSAQFGGMIWVTDESGVGYNDFLPNGTTGAGKNSPDFLVWSIGVILILGMAAILIANRTRLIPALQTTNWNVVTENAPISTKQTIAAIKNSALTPSDDVFKNIMEKVNNTKK